MRCTTTSAGCSSRPSPRSALAASVPYRREHLIDPEVLRWSVGFGLPATVAGAMLTRWISGGILVRITDVMIAGLGLRFLLRPQEGRAAAPGAPAGYRLR